MTIRVNADKKLYNVLYFLTVFAKIANIFEGSRNNRRVVKRSNGIIQPFGDRDLDSHSDNNYHHGDCQS
jgi:hypothetical protein